MFIQRVTAWYSSLETNNFISSIPSLPPSLPLSLSLSDDEDDDDDHALLSMVSSYLIHFHKLWALCIWDMFGVTHNTNHSNHTPSQGL